MKTISEICIAIDNANTIKETDEVRAYLLPIARKYSLVELRFMVKHLKEKERKLFRESREWAKGVIRSCRIE
jgi:hypothetical protein